MAEDEAGQLNLTARYATPQPGAGDVNTLALLALKADGQNIAL
jgi:hypothetical protein